MTGNPGHPGRSPTGAAGRDGVGTPLAVGRSLGRIVSDGDENLAEHVASLQAVQTGAERRLPSLQEIE